MPYAIGIGAWIVFAIAGFPLGFVLRKLRLLRDDNAVSVIGWCAAIPAGIFAVGVDGSPSLIIDILGRVAVFGLVWFIVGLMLGIGLLMGAEAAGSHPSPRKSQDATTQDHPHLTPQQRDTLHSLGWQSPTERRRAARLRATGRVGVVVVAVFVAFWLITGLQ